MPLRVVSTGGPASFSAEGYGERVASRGRRPWRWWPVAAVVAAAGCGAGTAPPPRSTPHLSVPAPDVFLFTVRERPHFDDVPDETLLAAGREVCHALDRGGDYPAVAAMVERELRP